MSTTTPDPSPWSVSWEPETKVLSVTAGSARHHFHTDPAESADFARRMRALGSGRDELAQLVGNLPATAPAAELKRRWLANVTAAGMDRAEALDFLEGRLAREGKG